MKENIYIFHMEILQGLCEALLCQAKRQHHSALHWLKVKQCQNEFMKSSFLPKYEQKIVKTSALCSDGRNFDNFSFVFWVFINSFWNCLTLCMTTRLTVCLPDSRLKKANVSCTYYISTYNLWKDVKMILWDCRKNHFKSFRDNISSLMLL